MKVKIEKLVYGGKGIGKLNDKICFVPFVIPDETVEVEIKKEKKRFYECKPVKIEEKSPFRKNPECTYFTYCGGCDYMHIIYEKQVELKNQIFVETLERIGKLADIPVKEPIPSPENLHYRNRAQFKVHREKVGFYQKESHSVVNIEKCVILKEDINQILPAIKELINFLPVKPEEIHVYSSSQKDKTLRFVFSKKIKRFPLGLKHIKGFLGEDVKGFGIYTKDKNSIRKLTFIGSPFCFEKVGNYQFRVSADSFFQINRFQIDNLITIIEEELKKDPPQTAFDLYCGVGTFSIPMAKYSQKVFGIEINPYAIQDANHNKKLNNTKNIKFIRGSSSQILQMLKEKNPDLVLVDPPRSGLENDITEILGSLTKLKKIIYISCNPSTLARDLKALTDKGFKISSTRIIDMFPHTYHIESITILEKN